MSEKTKLKRQLELLRPLYLRYKPQVHRAVAFSAVANLMMLVPTVYMLQVYDRVMVSRSEITLLVVSIIALGLLMCMGFAEWCRSRVLIASGVDLDLMLSGQVFEASYHEQLKTRHTQAASYFSDLALVRQTLTGNTVYALLDAPWTPVYVAVMFLLSPWLGLLSLVFLTNLTWLAGWGSKRTAAFKDESQAEEREYNSFVHNKLRNIEVIEAHGMQASLRERWWLRQQQVHTAQLTAEEVETRVTTFSKEVAVLKQSLALGVGAILVIKGDLSMGAMIAANFMMGRATAPMDTMVSGWRSFQQGMDALERITRLLDRNKVTTSRHVPESLRGEWELRGVGLTVEGRRVPILGDVSLGFTSGQVSAIIGPSGSGKSSLARAMLGLCPEFTGKVLLDGVPISDYDPDTFGRYVGYLPQDVELFDGTIAENIARMGKVDHEAVIEAANRVGMHETLLLLPDGYDTQIKGKAGILSAGQKQRVALARAVYGTPKLLVLDEPDSSLDEAGVAALEKVVQELRQVGTCVCLITHRGSLLNIADRVVVMSGGVVTKVTHPLEAAASAGATI
jgi:ATP-binding cassette, subfamily C, bacterial exporter for protease/lipase